MIRNQNPDDQQFSNMLMVSLITTLINAATNLLVELFKASSGWIQKVIQSVYGFYKDIRYGKLIVYEYESTSYWRKYRPYMANKFFQYIVDNHNFTPKFYTSFCDKIITNTEFFGGVYVGASLRYKSANTEDQGQKMIAWTNSFEFYTRLHTQEQFKELCEKLLKKSSKISDTPCIINYNNDHTCSVFDVDTETDVPYATTTVEQIKNDITKRTHSNILLYGPPGTGKTNMIKHIVNLFDGVLIVCNLNLFKDISQFRMFINQSEFRCVNKNNKDRLIKPKKKFFVFEDFDTMLPASFWKHEDATTHAEANKTADATSSGSTTTTTTTAPVTSTTPKNNESFKNYKYSDLLNLLDGIIKNKDVYMFFTTNHINKIDSAFYRPGRMTLKTYVGDLTINETIAFIKNKYSTDIEPEKITRRTTLAELYALESLVDNVEKFVDGLNNKLYDSLGKN